MHLYTMPKARELYTATAKPSCFRTIRNVSGQAQYDHGPKGGVWEGFVVSALRTRQTWRGVRGLILLHPSGNYGPIAEFIEASNPDEAQCYPYTLNTTSFTSLQTSQRLILDQTDHIKSLTPRSILATPPWTSTTPPFHRLIPKHKLSTKYGSK